MLSAMHGIGVIKLNPDNPEESQILIPARERSEVDWDACNRLAKNGHFNKFVKEVRKFYKKGKPREKKWQEPTDGWGD